MNEFRCSSCGRLQFKYEALSTGVTVEYRCTRCSNQETAHLDPPTPTPAAVDPLLAALRQGQWG